MLDQGPDSGWAQGQKYFALGLKFAGGVIVFVAMGFGLDRVLGTTPLFIVTGTLAGATLSFLSVYWEVTGKRGKGR